jgi:hypothetical protein
LRVVSAIWRSSAGVGTEELALWEALPIVRLVDGALDGLSDQTIQAEICVGRPPTRKIPSVLVLPVFADAWLMLGYSLVFIGWTELRCGCAFFDGLDANAFSP